MSLPFTDTCLILTTYIVKTASFLLGTSKHLVYDFVQTLDFRPLTLPEIQRVDVVGHTQTETFFRCEQIFEHLHNFPEARFVIIDGLPGWNNGSWDGSHFEQGSKVILLSANSPLLDATIAIRQNQFAFANLMYLDISGTRDNKGIFYGPEIVELNNLRILKMRNMRLTSIPSFLIGHQLRLWSLDLRNNFLTDHAIQYLLENFMLKPVPQAKPPVFQAADHTLFDSPPAYQEHDGERPIDICPLRPDSCDAFVEHMKSWKGDDSNPMYLQTGLTNLYISNNKCSSDVVRYLLSYNNRLQDFDVGSVRKEKNDLAYGLLLAGKSWATVQHIPFVQFKQPSRLERLRIHHSFITYIPTVLVDSDTGFHEPSLENSELWGQRAKIDREPTYDPLRDYRLKHLTLTGVQTMSHSGLLIEHLIEFIRKVTAQEQHIQQARAANPPHPPRSAPPMLSGLRLLRLEFIREGGSTSSGSVSGDKDADTFLERALGDFSFFGGKREEKNGKESSGGKGREKKVYRDVVAELKVFRATEVPRWTGTLQLITPA